MYSTRKSVAHTVAIAKTQCMPRIHFLPIDMLNLQPLGMAFLDIVQLLKNSRTSTCWWTTSRSPSLTITPVVGKGWRALPRGRTTLDDNVAGPSE